MAFGLGVERTGFLAEAAAALAAEDLVSLTTVDLVEDLVEEWADSVGIGVFGREFSSVGGAESCVVSSFFSFLERGLGVGVDIGLG